MANEQDNGRTELGFMETPGPSVLVALWSTWPPSSRSTGHNCCRQGCCRHAVP